MNTGNSSIGRGRRIVGNVLIGFGGLALLGSAATKILQVPKVVEGLGALGFSGNRLMFIAALEIISLTLFLVPVTRSIGLLLISAYLGGAISAHLGHGENIFPPSLILAIAWLGAWLRHPEILWSLNRASLHTSQSAEQRNSGTMLRQA
jgi:hypothetical protein